VGEVESLKDLWTSFPVCPHAGAAAVSVDLHGLLEDALSLYRGLLAEVEIRTHFGEGLPRSRWIRQFRRVILNLVDNAIEAMDRKGAIEIETCHDAKNNIVRVVVPTTVPGFRRPSGTSCFSRTTRPSSGKRLGLASSDGSWRSTWKHRLTDNVPRGTRFAIELPC